MLSVYYIPYSHFEFQWRWFTSNSWITALVFLAVALGFELLTGLIEFYMGMAVLAKVHIICREGWLNEPDPWAARNIDDIINTLLRVYTNAASTSVNYSCQVGSFTV